MIKKFLKDYVPYKYMKERREKQHIEILKVQEEPPVYNQRGERKRVFYLEDTLCQHTPYTLVLGQYPEKVLWDRNNVGLPIHFYSHESIWVEEKNYAKKKFALLFESESIRESDFVKAKNDVSKMKEFNKIFTFSEQILNQYENAAFLPASGLWYGTDINGGEWDEKLYEQKEKNISVVASNKQHSSYHKLRVQIAKDAMELGMADGYGAFCGNRINKKADALTPYRYSIVVENDVNAYYFTEKILDCFASMTIPIYVGATKINQFFNDEGIIVLKKEQYQDIGSVLKECTKENYENRLDAIKDNWNRVKEYRCIEDYMMTHYAEEFEV